MLRWSGVGFGLAHITSDAAIISTGDGPDETTIFARELAIRVMRASFVSQPRGSFSERADLLRCRLAASKHRVRRLRPFLFQSSAPWYRQSGSSIPGAPALSHHLIATDRGIVDALPAPSAAILLSSCSARPLFPPSIWAREVRSDRAVNLKVRHYPRPTGSLHIGREP